MTAVAHDIVAKLWNLGNVLKNDGVTYHQYQVVARLSRMVPRAVDGTSSPG